MQMFFVYSSEQLEKLSSFFGLCYFQIIVFVMNLVIFVIIKDLTDAEKIG